MLPGSPQRASASAMVMTLISSVPLEGSLGSVGAVVGSVLPFHTEGIDFALTALFVTVFVEQWISTGDHIPALIGVLCSVICLVIFGPGSFLIPAMVLITAALALYGKRKGGTGND